MQKKTAQKNKFFALSAAALMALGLSACGSDDSDSGSDEAQDNDVQLEVEDPWTKAVDADEDSMTAVFGELTNTSDKDITLVGAEADYAGHVELHETVESDGDMQMQEIEGGFDIPAGGTLSLEPGGDHIMPMDLDESIEAGADYELTLIFDDDSTQTIEFPGRDFAGAQEEYGDEEGEMDHDEMDHGDMDHGDEEEGDGEDHSGH